MISRINDRRATRNLSGLYRACDFFRLLVHDMFTSLDEFVGLISESRSLAL
jgi:hypothetical protein